MKVLFIQKSAIPQLGIMSLSAILKKNNHQVEICLTEDYLKKIENYKPDLIASSVTTGEHKLILNIAKEIKKRYDIPIILGGPHPTYFPEILNEKEIDMICIGEGDLAILELANKIEKKQSINKIKNLWIKKEDKIYKNPLRELVNSLDDLPFPDRKIYYETFKFLKESKLKIFSSGRGCPYNCTFCFNHSLKKVYLNKGKYIRKVSVDYLINEIKEAKKEYPLELISFTDDTFIFDKKWLREFSEKYSSEINIPFVCNVRANLVDEEMILLLKKANCYAVGMGIETGSDYLRNEILKKGITNEQIIKAGRLIKESNIKLKTYNMFGYPKETLEDAFETIKLNALIKPDQASTAIIQPYPRTEFCDYAIQEGTLDNNFNVDQVPETLRESSPLKIKYKKEFENLLAFAFFTIKNPWFMPITKILIKAPNNRIYDLIKQVTYGYYMSKYYNMSYKDIIAYLTKMKYKFA